MLAGAHGSVPRAAGSSSPCRTAKPHFISRQRNEAPVCWSGNTSPAGFRGWARNMGLWGAVEHTFTLSSPLSILVGCCRLSVAFIFPGITQPSWSGVLSAAEAWQVSWQCGPACSGLVMSLNRRWKSGRITYHWCFWEESLRWTISYKLKVIMDEGGATEWYLCPSG